MQVRRKRKRQEYAPGIAEVFDRIYPEFYTEREKETIEELFPAWEWIDELVILEAKALLNSSSMNIQEIADRLNFANQSFFGKYFKHYT